MTNQPKLQKISLVKVPSLKVMTDEQRREWAYQLHAKLVAKMQGNVPEKTTELEEDENVAG
jgi:hypothetical protein